MRTRAGIAVSIFCAQQAETRSISQGSHPWKKSNAGRWSAGVTEHARRTFPTEPEGFASSVLLCVTFLLVVPGEPPRPRDGWSALILDQIFNNY